VRAGAVAMMFKELGMEVVAVRAYHYDNGADAILEAMAEELPEVPVSVSNQIFELINQVNRFKPDLVISHSGTQGWLSKIGANSVPLFNVEKVYFGYVGVFSTLRRIVFSFKNTSYQKRLSRHVKLPYFKEWYEKDAHSYIKD
jgi:nitrogenase molybdenum-iron protein alpha chain